MPGAVLFGGEQEATHHVEILRLVREVDDYRILILLLTGEDGLLPRSCQQKYVRAESPSIDSRSIDGMYLHLVEGHKAWSDAVEMMGQHQLTAFGKHLVRQVEECLLVGVHNMLSVLYSKKINS